MHALIPATPQYAWPKLRVRAGCEVWVKHENHTPTGAFKVRGGLVYLERLAREQPGTPGVVSATRGNHGQSIAYAAARVGIPATIYVPIGNSPDQNSAMRSWGATVIEHGADFDTAKHEAHRVAAQSGLHFVPSFHRDLVLGVASYALEFLRALPDLDTIYVGVGMGSGICGLILVRDLLGLADQDRRCFRRQCARYGALLRGRAGGEHRQRDDLRGRDRHARARRRGRGDDLPRRRAHGGAG